MKACIMEQPDTMRDVIRGAEEQMKAMEAIGKGSFGRIFLIGSGTSLHAAYAAKYAFMKYTGAEVQVFTPFDYLNYGPVNRIDSNTLVLGISQTARSIGTIHCMELSREKGARTVFVTAEPENPGAASAEAILDTCTGTEMVGAKTKGFTSTMAMLYVYAAWLGGAFFDLTAVPDLMEETLNRTEKYIADLADEYSKASSVTLIGGGPLGAAVKEGGLKMLEGVRIPVEVYDCEEYMHGPYHCLEKHSHLIFMVNGGPGTDRALKLIRFAQDHSDHVLVIGEEDLPKHIDLTCQFIPLPIADEMLTPLYYPIPIQWLANDATERKGRHPEQSRYPQFHAILGSKYMPKVNYYEG